MSDLWTDPLWRRDNDPCPGANGTTIGTTQKFTLLCGLNVVGDVINTPDVDTFEQCADLCASFHPKCEAVSFSRRKCEFKANVKESKTHNSRFTDAAMAIFPSASSNCGRLGRTTRSNGMQFNLFCDNVINGDDIVQNFAPTFQDCLDQCSQNDACKAVSYDAKMTLGFKNCYLKTANGSNAPLSSSGVDTAVFNAAAAENPSPSGSASPSAQPAPSSTSVAPANPAVSDTTQAAAQPSTTAAAVATSQPVAATTSPPAAAPAASTSTSSSSAAAAAGGGSFFTPPVPVVLPQSVSTQTIVSIITSMQDSVPTVVSTTQILTVPVTQTAEVAAPPPAGGIPETGGPAGGAAPTSTAAADAAATDSSRAWIAAPVVGSVAAVMVIAVAFVMWGRRRSAARSSSLFSRLPFTRAGGGGGSRGGGEKGAFGGSQRGFGNYWRTGQRLADEESRAGVSSQRSTRPPTRLSTPQFEVHQGKIRESGGGGGQSGPASNGLGLNKPNLDGIPSFLRE
ncbi:uncharacterized protein E0L32_000533 [Thyridium curvatum]|uniref:Apple domain-containing protein n=1 Tax=Thyridium curvatum TaxID=1093900 RepID=A0A507B9S1_9PEZI|nr:uncharacterized protein E0L32_000533 [Thyridium curvatum]TPX14139.1 hypothetical protein E0L32_000533 [Thyridium curvatum]